ncbi:MAG: beta-ketoacyl synthase N-terminal-like domain-containing protein [Pseudomonadota bacterium]
MSRSSDIAIIGMSAVYAGARDLRALWQNILNKVYAVSDAGPQWAEPYLDPSSKAVNRVYTQQGGWLHELARFDPREFGVMPNAVDGREPDHFLALKHAHDALADAGYTQRPFDREKAGIILGRGNNVNRGQATLLGHGYFIDEMLELVAKLRPDFTSREIDALRDGLAAQLPQLTAEILPGMIPNVNTGIVANRLDLMGPNFILDAACASVLVAVEQATRELQSGRCDLMLAGGVHAQTPPQNYMIFSIINALARDRIRPFQKGANGTLLGEGCGIVVLRRLEDAERDGDKIYAVIKGTGVASDGKAKGLFAPREEGQVLALKRAYAASGIDPATVELIEAHATGIALGDRTEIRSLAQIYGPRRGRLPTVAIGSVKSMIAHAVPASAGASLMKAALALRHRVLPPTLCDEPAPELELEKTPFYINTETRPWVHNGKTPRRAGVDAFGFGGINAHAILEEYVPRARKVQVAVPHAPGESELLLLGAGSRPDLLAAVNRLRARLADATPATLPELARACAQHAGGEHRLAIVAADAADLDRKLQQVQDRLGRDDAAPFKTRGGVFYGTGSAAGKLCFLFPGEGAQYPNMLADVCVGFPQALAWFDALDRADDGSPRAAVVYPPPTAIDADTRAQLEAQIYEMDHAAESVFAASMALHAVLESIGLKADAMLGHSTGENTALTAARLRRYKDPEEIAQAVRDLNRLFRELDARGEIVTGSLLTVGALKPEQRAALLADPGEHIVVAMDNCPNQLVLFGPPAAIGALRETMAAEGAICMELPFGRAYHTALFKPMADAYRRYFKPADFGRGSTQLYSACSVGPFPQEPAEIIEQVAAQWENRVRFTETLTRLYADGYRYFVEVGPSANLTSFVTDTLRDRDDVLAVATNSRRRSGIGQLHTALAQLHAAGVVFDAPALYAHREIAVIDLGLPHVVKQQPVLDRTMPRLRWPQTMPVPPLPQTIVERPAAAAATAPSAPPGPRLAFLQTHFSLMQEFLDSQARVMGLASLPGPSAAGPAPGGTEPASPSPEQAPEAFPLLGEIVEHDPQRLVMERRYALDSDLFLRDHTIGAAPSARDTSLLPIAVVPFTFSMEILAEAAMRLVDRRDRRVVAIEQARGNRWLSLDDDSVLLRIVAEREAASATEDRIGVRLFMLGAGPQPGLPGGMLVFEGSVVLAEHYPQAPQARAWSSADEHPPRNNPDGELYSHGMFHGPRLQGVKHLRRWGAESIEADLEAIPTHDYFSFTPRPRFQLDAAMLDAAGQLAGYWLAEKHGWGYNCFPFRLGRLSMYAPPPAAGTRVLGRGDLRFTGENLLEARFDLIDGQGRVLVRADGWEDRSFAVPRRYYDFRIRPQQEFMTRPWPENAVPDGWLLRRMEPFPPQFLDEGGAIWKRMLAHMVLNHAERRQFYALPATGPRREEWLMGRIAAKEAVRDWAARRGVAVAAADIEIAADAQGAPRILCPALSGQPLPQLSISHSRRWAVAALGPADEAVGLDYQRLDQIDAEALIAGGLNAAERHWLPGPDDSAERLRVAVALWCAKEAAAKAFGTGLAGRPQDWRVIAAQLDRRSGEQTQARVRHGGLEFDVVLHFNGSDEVLALCGASVRARTPASQAPLTLPPAVSAPPRPETAT